MSIITELKLQKSKTRANVYLDGQFACGLELSTIVKNQLKVGVEISKDKLEQMQAESEVERATEKALGLLERQKYTKKQIRTKLASKGYLPVVVDQVITKLEAYGYISDEDYAESFLRATSTKSKKEIKFALMTKGVSEKIINEVLEDSEFSEEETVKKLAEKFMRYKENTAENKKKLVAYLYRKGFDYGLISRVVDGLDVDFYD